MSRRSPLRAAGPPTASPHALERAGRTGVRRGAADRRGGGEGRRGLGEALGQRGEIVLARAAEVTGGSALAPELQGRFEQFDLRATASLARWLSGESEAAAHRAGRDASRFYGEMASRHEVPLQEIVRRCLAWREAVAQTLREIAGEQRIAPAALDQALQGLQLRVERSLVLIAKSIDAERERTDHELTFMATHDPLTGLSNRPQIVSRAEQLLAGARRRGTPVAALILGIDNLAGLRETIGHEKADELLRAIGGRLGGCVRDTDALGRLGEDQFAVVVEGDALNEGPLRLGERLREALCDPFPLAGEAARVTVSCCVGVAAGPRASAEELLRDADVAMRHTRWEGRHGLTVFERGMEEAVESRRELEVDLHDALARNELELAYQPIVAIAEMRPTGMEALLRWRHPSRGMVAPGTFIPLLEESELIVEVGGWVLAQACRFAAGCRRRGRPIEVAVNVSARQLDDEQLVCQVREALAESGLPPSRLTLEMTETALMRNVEDAARALAALHELGVRVAIDDFGTGYSSLSHLQMFPIDELKIDRSFVARLDGEKPDATLLRTMLQLGKELSLQTVAEGIETPGQLAILGEWGCDRGQGFLLARPLPPDSLRGLLASGLPALGAAAPPA